MQVFCDASAHPQEGHAVGVFMVVSPEGQEDVQTRRYATGESTTAEFYIMRDALRHMPTFGSHKILTPETSALDSKEKPTVTLASSQSTIAMEGSGDMK